MNRELAHEYPPAGEADAINKVVELLRTQYQTKYAELRPAQRGFHAKPHACVRATFQVMANLPEALRHGLFSQPRTYDAIIRFSNGSPNAGADATPDVRGMAIKVLGVAGEKLLPEERHDEAQDFIMMNTNVFFVKHVADLALVIEAFTYKGVQLLWRLFTFIFGWNPCRWRLRELIIFIRAVMQKPSSPLTTIYWSTTPYGLGPGAMKFRASPITRGLPLRSSTGENFLFDTLAQQLAEHDVDFDFGVQCQANARAMPIEDPTRSWDETLSPYQKVASIHIPAQHVSSPAAGEDMYFTPWHSLPEHRPLGGINRVRLPVYTALSKLRFAYNQTSPHNTL